MMNNQKLVHWFYAYLAHRFDLQNLVSSGQDVDFVDCRHQLSFGCPLAIIYRKYVHNHAYANTWIKTQRAIMGVLGVSTKTNSSRIHISKRKHERECKHTNEQTNTITCIAVMRSIRYRCVHMGQFDVSE